MFSKKASIAAAMAVGAVFTASNLQAALLSSGGTIYPMVAEVDPVGGVVKASTTSPITAPTFTGTLTTTVIEGDTSNPYGGLTFTYLLTNAAGSPDDLARLTVSSFAGYFVDASYQSGGGTAPALVTRAAVGDVVGFDFNGLGAGMISPGGSSALLVLQTNSSTWTPTIAAVIDSSVATTASFAPAPGGGVPEPATLSMAAAGTVALLLRRRRG
jgi:hypothetical protein